MCTRYFTPRPLLGVLVAAFLVTGAILPASAAERIIGWQDLAPTVEPYDDPFKALTYDGTTRTSCNNDLYHSTVCSQ